MRYAPVAMFVYNREDHFKSTYEALTKCPEAENTILYIFSDGAKDIVSERQVTKVRKLAAQFIKRCEFKKIILIESSSNKGLASSIISGVTQVMEEYGKVIVLEDDCVVSPYFLRYMNACLNYYKEDKRIGTISGYTPMIHELEEYPQDVFLAYRSCSCSWSTWKDRWDNVDWMMTNFSDFYRNPSLVKSLNANGNDRFIRLYRQSKGNGSSWSIRFGAHLVKEGMYTVYPRTSYIKNIGCDESGVHSKSEDAELVKVDLELAKEDFKLDKLEINNRIQRALKKHYSGGFISRIKREFVTRIIIFKGRVLTKWKDQK